MKIEIIQERTPSAWETAVAGRLEGSELVIRNLSKVSLDKSSPFKNAAELALNVYKGIESHYESESRFAHLALDACGLAYVIIHKQAWCSDLAARDVESILTEVEIFVLKTVLGHVPLNNGDGIADCRQKMKGCLAKHSGKRGSSEATIREAVMDVVVKKLMNYEDMETKKGASTSLAVRKAKQKMDEPAKSDIDSPETESSDDSSERSESDVEIVARREKGKGNSKTMVGNKGKTLAKFGDRPVQMGSAKNPGNYRRKNFRAKTLYDHPVDESDEEVDPRDLLNHLKGPHRRSTAPVPRHFASHLDDIQPLGQLLANNITSHVMSAFQNSMAGMDRN